MNTTDSKTEDPRKGLPSASAAPRLFACPGSNNLARVTKKVETEDKTRDQGLRIHKAWETGDLTGLSLEEKDGTAVLMKLEAKAFVAWCEQHGISEPPQKMRETRFWMRNAKGEPVMSAQIDVGYKSGKYALIIDGKTGFLDPDPAELSAQLRVQAVSFWQENPDVEEIVVGFAKSRLASFLDTVTYTLYDLQESERMIFRALWESEQHDAQRRPGAHCRYCPCLGTTCAESVSWSQLDIIPAMSDDKVQALWKVSQLSPVALAEIHKKKKIIEVILDAATRQLRAMPEEDLNKLGLMKKANAGKRKVKDTVAAFELLTNAVIDPETNEKLPALMTQNEFAAVCSIPIGKTVEMLQTKFECSEKAAEEMMEKRIGTTIELEAAEPSVVPLKKQLKK